MARDRIYLPLEEIRRFGYSEEELRREVRNDAQRRLMAFQVQRAQSLFQNGAKLLPYLSIRSRACPAVLAAIYTRILRRISSNDYNVFGGRISLSSREKLLVTTTTWLKSLLPSLIQTPNSDSGRRSGRHVRRLSSPGRRLGSHPRGETALSGWAHLLLYRPETGQVVDNGQHVFLGCCTYYMDFLEKIGTLQRAYIQDRPGLMWSAPTDLPAP